MLDASYRKQLLEQLASFLGAGRIAHSANVAAAAVGLAQRYAPQFLQLAELAGLLHDNAKRMDGSELIAQAARFDIEVTDVERQWPALLHGKVGAALLPERFGVDDALVAQAVAWHVTGHPNMGQLECILFVADQTAADREFDGVQDLRVVAETSLQRAVYMVSRFKLAYALQRGRPIEPTTVDVFNAFREYGN